MLLLFCLILFSGFLNAFPIYENASVCDQVKSQLPHDSVVSCTLYQCDVKGINFKCNVTLYDTEFAIHTNLELCTEPVSTGLEFWHDNKKIFDKNVTASTNFGIPGLTIGVPFLAKAGLFCQLNLGGKDKHLQLDINVQACAEVLDNEVCYPKPNGLHVVSLNLEYVGWCTNQHVKKKFNF